MSFSDAILIILCMLGLCLLLCIGVGIFNSIGRRKEAYIASQKRQWERYRLHEFMRNERKRQMAELKFRT